MGKMFAVSMPQSAPNREEGACRNEMIRQGGTTLDLRSIRRQDMRLGKNRRRGQNVRNKRNIPKPLDREWEPILGPGTKLGKGSSDGPAAVEAGLVWDRGKRNDVTQ